MPPKKRAVHLQQARAFRELKSEIVAHRANQQHTFTVSGFQDQDPFIEKPESTHLTRNPTRSRTHLISSDELHHDPYAVSRSPVRRPRGFVIVQDPALSDELHRNDLADHLSTSSDEIYDRRSATSTHISPVVLINALQPSTRSRISPVVLIDAQRSPVQTRISPVVLINAPGSPLRPRISPVVLIGSSDSSSILSTAHTSRESSAFASQPTHVQTTPRTARRIQTRDHAQTQSPSQRRRRLPINTPSGSPENDDEFGPGLEEFFADIDDLDATAADETATIAEYYSSEYEGAALRRSEFFNVAKQPHHSVVDYRHILLSADRTCVKCGAKHWIEERITSTTQRNPTFRCCGDGRVVVPSSGPYPQELQRLLFETEIRRGKRVRTARSQKFHMLIRHYNNAFAFCSLGVSFDRDLAQATIGSYTFRVHGNVYHRIASLDPGPHQPSFAQIWIFDTAEERVNLRRRAFENLELPIVRLIENTLLSINPFVQSLQANRIRLRTEPNIQLELRIVERKENDPRTYNRPTASEVAALVPTAVSDAAKTRSVIVFPTVGHHTIRISDKSRVYFPLRYPLLCPFGETGWGDTYPAWDARLGAAPQYTMEPRLNVDEIEEEPLNEEDLLNEGDGEQIRRGRNGSTRVSQQQWFRHYLQIREPPSALLHAGRLFHEVCVDAFASILTDRLTWVRQNQDSIRMIKANGLLDAAAHDADGADVGLPVILPPSFTGSPRQMHRSYLDAMALARQLGAPDFFITFTCNPLWIEVQRELIPGQSSCDRPDLVNRVFFLKLKQLLRELYTDGIFGTAATTCWTIEFQKRGLPHAHILLILEPSSRCVTAEDVDATVSAELPDPLLEPLLYTVVTRFMLHGPCGPQAPHSGCMRDGKCRWGYPKAFCEETSVNNGRIVYRRVDNGRSFTKGARMDKMYDNRNVAPYNAYLSKRFNAHINVEACIGFGSVKYLYKYVYKGPDFATGRLRTATAAPDRAQMQVQNAAQTRDEVQAFINSRYISANEAVWRIFEFPTHGRDVAVTVLQIHLEGEQCVVVDTTLSLADQTARAEKKTTLTAYFEQNLRNPALNVKYQDFPAQFVYNKRVGEWRPRTRKPAIGRITWINVSAGELFYLRLLLVNVAGQTSFEDARTHEGTVYPTYHAACLARGLLDDDGEWASALEEAARFHTGHALRALFMTIIINCAPADTMALWTRFARSLSDDCEHHLRTKFGFADPTPAQCEDLALFYIQEQLATLNWTMRRARLPAPTHTWLDVLATEGNRLLQEQRSYDVESLNALLARDKPRLNVDQRRAFETITHDAIEGRGGLFFLDGPGGTGKTFVQNMCLAELRSRGLIALAVATTGIAATLLAGGTTAHSRFKIPVKDLDADSTCNIPKGTHLAELICATDLIFWDEAVMCHRHAFEAVSRTLQDLRDNDDPRKDLPFGGITVCFCGDFRQILPVVKKGTRGQIVEATLRRTSFWQRVNVLRLMENMRLRREGLDDVERREIAAFAQKLLRIGEETGSDEYVDWGLQSLAIDNSVSALATDIYRDLQRRPLDGETLRSRAILAPYNEVVGDLNKTLLATMPGPQSTFLSVDQCAADCAAAYPTEFLHAINVAELPPHELRLKVGCPVLLLRNLDPPNGLCNGTRLRVHRLGRNVITCTILGSAHHGKQVDLPRIPMGCGGGIIEGLEFQRRQFPVRVAFAMTINKAQGQSFDRVGLLLQREVFSHGQLYVALSRVTSPDGVTMVLPANDAARRGKVRNIVYAEALL